MIVTERSAMLTLSLTSSCSASNFSLLCYISAFSSLVLHYCTILKELPVLVPKPGWLVMFPPVLVKGELRLYQQFDGVELAHLPFLVFLSLGAQWILCGWIVVHAALLEI
jgi:hypothetical protein